MKKYQLLFILLLSSVIAIFILQKCHENKNSNFAPDTGEEMLPPQKDLYQLEHLDFLGQIGDRSDIKSHCRSIARNIQNITTNTRHVQTLTVPIAWHMITSDNEEGRYKADMMNNQIDTLNRYFNTANIVFVLQEFDETHNNDWFDYSGWGSNYSYEYEMVEKLRHPVNKFLNIYTVNGDENFLGLSSFPWDEMAQSTDGILINYRSLPNGNIDYFNQGKTLVHEVGHYFGLLHTFHMRGPLNDCSNSIYYNGCGDEYNDMCSDTPRQRNCHFGDCGVTKNTCPEDGNDPINNIMGYNYDKCLTEFTPCQVDRMRNYLLYFRRELTLQDNSTT